MCRTIESGGRRCPQHTDPVKHAAYNARRRELYAAKKNGSLDNTPKRPPVPVDPLGEQYGFKPLTENRAPILQYGDDSPEFKRYLEESEAFENKLMSKISLSKTPMHIILKDYTANGFNQVRDYLNGKTFGQFEMEQQDKKYSFKERYTLKQEVKTIDKAIKLADKPKDNRIVYRGLVVPMHVKNADAGEWVKNKFPVGQIISQKHYMSTTLDPSIALHKFSNAAGSSERKVIFEIMTKQGAPLTRVSIFSEEMEVLMPREAKFRVVSVTENVEFKSHSKWALAAPNPYVEPEMRTIIRLVDESAVPNSEQKG